MFPIGLIEFHAAEGALRELNGAYVTQCPRFQSVDENAIAHAQRRFPASERRTIADEIRLDELTYSVQPRVASVLMTAVHLRPSGLIEAVSVIYVQQ